MSHRKEKIAQLYYRSESIKFGSFELSVHRDTPELPRSPWYLHYPKKGPGTILLPSLFYLIGQEFHDMAEQHDPALHPMRIAGLPSGAVGIGREFARHYRAEYPDNLLHFDKAQHADGKTEFTLARGQFQQGDTLLPCEDHISAARNNLLFLAHARSLGLVVAQLFVVVDRQQGATANLAAHDVNLHSIFTGDDMLDYGLAEGHITQTIYDDVQEYRAANEYSLAELTAA